MSTPQFQPYTPAWNVPMPEGVVRRPLAWYLDRSRRIAAEREGTVVLEAEAILAAAHLDPPPGVPRQRDRGGPRRSGGGAEDRPPDS